MNSRLNAAVGEISTPVNDYMTRCLLVNLRPIMRSESGKPRMRSLASGFLGKEFCGEWADGVGF